MCEAAGDHIIENELFDRMRIPPIARPQIRRTWEPEPPSVYGRFDLRYDGEGPPKLLEFNADTPTGLVESAVTQWNWHLFTGQGADQWNALHDKLVAAWQRNLSSGSAGPACGRACTWRGPARRPPVRTG